MLLIDVALVIDPPRNVPTVKISAVDSSAVLGHIIHNGVTCGGVGGPSSLFSITTAATTSVATSVRIAELRMLPGSRDSGGGAVAYRVAYECVQRHIRYPWIGRQELR